MLVQLSSYGWRRGDHCQPWHSPGEVGDCAAALAAASPDLLPAHVDAAFSEAVDQHVAGLFASELFNN
jgi:hypothetical protein